MNRFFAILSICCGLALVSRIPLEGAPSDAKKTHHHHASSCAEACSQCAISCNSCVEHCIMQLSSGKQEHLSTLKLCNDCADLCSLAARIESRSGPLNRLVCEACAKACDKCSAECSKFKDQPHMMECAKSCESCATACREMISHHQHTK